MKFLFDRIASLLGLLILWPDKVRLNKYYYYHHPFTKDIEMIFATVLGKKVWFAGEEI